MRTFDYSFLEHRPIPACFVNLVSEISVLQERINNRRDSLGEVLKQLEPIAAERSAKAATEITRCSVDEYRKTLALIHDDSAHPAFGDDLQEDDIRRLYGILFPSAQNYRAVTTDIEAKLKGNQNFRFSPTNPQEISAVMKQLVNAYAEARDNPNINRLLLIPCFAFDFLCIFPFAEGNGRMSRLLSQLLLFKSGFDVGRYISFEEKICESKDEYFAVIRKCSDGWRESKNDYFSFAKYFLDTLLLCYRELDKYKGQARNGGNVKQITKSQQIRDVVLNSLIPVSKQEICTALPDVSATTVESVLGVAYSESESADLVDVSARNERREHLKHFTADTKILDNVDSVAFTQEELEQLAESGRVRLICVGRSSPYQYYGKSQCNFTTYRAGL